MATDDTDIYIVKSTLLGWKGKMATINEAAIKTVNSYRTEANAVDLYLKGNFSEDYISNANALMDEAIYSHEAMTDIEAVLQDVVNKADSE